MNEFAGFPSDFFNFFDQLSQNNNRDWFYDNKSRFQQSVLEPMSQFIAAIQPRLAAISRHYIVDPKPDGGSMFCVQRDTRFSKDKSPFNTHASCHFLHAAGKDMNVPGFYVHLDRDEVFFGGGIWMPPAPRLRAIRHFIAENARAWARITNSKKVKDAGGIKGRGLRCPPPGFHDQHLHIEDLKRKSFYVITETSVQAPASDNFVDQVTQGFSRAAPLNRFVCDALAIPF